MLNKNYQIELNQITWCGKEVALDIGAVIKKKKLDKANTVVLFGEIHPEIGHHFVQAKALEGLNRTIGVTNFCHERPRKEQKEYEECRRSTYNAVIGALHEKTSSTWISVCSAYPLVHANINYKAMDTDLTRRDPTSSAGLSYRDKMMSKAIIMQMKDNPGLTVCSNGRNHLADSEYPKRETLVEKLLKAEKEVITVGLHYNKIISPFFSNARNAQWWRLSEKEQDRYHAHIDIVMPDTEAADGMEPAMWQLLSESQYSQMDMPQLKQDVFALRTYRERMPEVYI